MNLVTDPWIPVLNASGESATASLTQIFTDVSSYRDLAVRPHERVALMRLLICIAQAALNGPKDYEEWCLAPDKLPSAAGQYLAANQGAFNLFDPEKPFMQVASLMKPKKEIPKSSSTKKEKAVVPADTADKTDEALTSVSKLDFSLATGDNTTLFDHQATGEDKRSFPLSALALMLVTFQCFSPGGTIGVAMWGQTPTRGWSSYPTIKSGHSSHGPCLPKNMLHAFIRRVALFDTICANLLTQESVAQQFNKQVSECWGAPLWEAFPSGPSEDTSTWTYLGRLVPLTRSILIRQRDQQMLLANGLDYPTFEEGVPAEASATVVVNKKEQKRQLLSASFKAIWRELPSLIVNRKRDTAGGAITLLNLPENESFDLWVGALIADKANVLDTVEAVLHVPAKMRTGVGRSTYEKGVEWSEQLAGKLEWAVETYRGEVDRGWEGRLKAAKDKRELKRKLHANATRHFWTAVEKVRWLLLAHVEAIGTSAKEVERTRKAWRREVHRAARDSYKLACGQNTSRQIRAFALGWAKLFTPPKAPEEIQETETAEMEAINVG